MLLFTQLTVRVHFSPFLTRASNPKVLPGSRDSCAKSALRTEL